MICKAPSDASPAPRRNGWAPVDGATTSCSMDCFFSLLQIACAKAACDETEKKKRSGHIHYQLRYWLDPRGKRASAGHMAHFAAQRHCLAETETPMRVIMAVLLYPSSSSSLIRSLPCIEYLLNLQVPAHPAQQRNITIRYLLPPISSRKLGRDDSHGNSNFTTHLRACSDHRACTSPHTKVKRGLLVIFGRMIINLSIRP